MDITPIQTVSPTTQADTVKINVAPKKNIAKNNLPDNFLEADIKQALDNATGLIQSITTDKLSETVIRKMPTDEYLHLLSLLDEIISGSIDKHV